MNRNDSDWVLELSVRVSVCMCGEGGGIIQTIAAKYDRRNIRNWIPLSVKKLVLPWVNVSTPCIVQMFTAGQTAFSFIFFELN